MDITIFWRKAMPNLLRKFFWLFNKTFMVPIFRLGLGPFIGNKVSGYIMILKTVGRKTGKTRYTLVNYAIQNGYIYCLSGWGKHADWYLNMMEAKGIEVILPGGSVYGELQDVADPKEKRVVVRKILQNAGFAGFFEGFNPYSISDELLEQKTTDMTLVKIHPDGIGSGASDPGGYSFIWILVSILLIVLIIVFKTK
jgi:deazaflavin-dependent oxidoreductase (nitroreductase family)